VDRGSTVLFVHGAHLAGWCWLLIMERLAREAIHSAAIDLPFSGYADDVAAVQASITSAAARGPVHVVCHSYAGLPVSGGGHAASHLTFVAGRLPLPGESPAEATPEWGFPDFQACMVVGEDDLVRLTPEAGPLMFNRTSPPLAELAMARVRPMTSTVPSEPLADPAWTSVPSSYVVTTDDRAVRPEAQRERAAMVPASIELDADHSPFFSCARELSSFILQRHRVMVGE
jgi:hypothetical protein